MTGAYGGSLQFWNYGDDGWGNKFTITDNGNVGIGTLSPNEKLQITSGTTHLLIAPGELDNVVNADWVTLDIPGTKNFRIWDNLSISGKVGIGTVSPNQELHIKGASHTEVKIEAPGNYNAGIILNEAANIRWVLCNDANEGDRFRISNGSYDLVTVEQNGNVGIGTSNPSNKLDVLGTIRAEEIIVETGWADYVFEEDYIRMGLDELESYIAQRGHLPGIPTEKEVKENGIGLGEFQVKLLQKIEELTLYIIDQKKEINRLQKEIAKLK